MLHSRIDWLAFLKGYVKAHSVVYPLLWSGFLLLSVCLWIARRRRVPREYLIAGVPAAFTVSVALGGLILELLFVEVTGVAPFPRYFLPGALFLALALESTLAAAGAGLRAAVGVGALLLTVVPTWSWLTQRHTNADTVAAVLEQQARPNDLVVISPWFLHTSFQRYYRGGTEWTTVPELVHYPMMRYDLIKDVILHPGPDDPIERRLRATLASEGAIWFVSQRVWTNLDRREAPERPGITMAPGGVDYVRFRSFWERDIEYRLRACCQPVDVPLPVAGRVWDEENLMLTRWQPR